MSNYDEILNQDVILPADFSNISAERSHSYIPNMQLRDLSNRKKRFYRKKVV